jgi:hypothetical protein
MVAQGIRARAAGRSYVLPKPGDKTEKNPYVGVLSSMPLAYMQKGIDQDD